MVITNWINSKGGGGNGNGNGNGKGKGNRWPCAFTLAGANSSIAPMLDFLRSIRDNHLRKSRVGTHFVNSYEWIYYTITPEVAKVVVKNRRFKNFWKKLVVTPVTYFLTGIFTIFSKIN